MTLKTPKYLKNYKTSEKIYFDPNETDANSEDFYVTVHTPNQIALMDKKNLLKLGNKFIFKNEIKENLYITALRNYHKTNNFLKLLNNLSEKLITEEEFGNELNENEDKYVVHANEEVDLHKLKIISEIVQKIGIDFSVDEVSELFSIDPIKLEKVSSHLLK